MNPTRTLVLAATLAALAAGCDNDVYVMSEAYEIKGDERIPAGGGCMLALDGPFGNGGAGSSGGDPAGDFIVSEHTEDHHFVVVVTSGEAELASRKYSEKFLRSGERDEFSVTTNAGRHYELAYWGGDTCDTSHLQRDDAGP